MGALIVLYFILMHLLNIIIFTFIYSYLPTGSFTYNSIKHSLPNMLDFFNLSVTTQAGVGISSIQPITASAILMSTIQQLLVMFKNIFILYCFSQI